MSSRHNDAGRRLFVGRLSLNTEDGVMRNYFERYGALSDCVVMRRPDTLQSRGFGFVTFVHPESLEQCMAVGSSSHWIDGRQVELSRATAKNPAKTFGGGNSGYGGRDAAKPILGDVEVDRRLFIGRLSFTTSDEALRDYFGRWGQLESGSVMRWPETLKSRGFGFVTFKFTQSMEQCLAHAGTHTLDGSEIVITRARNKVDGGSSAPGGAKRKWNDDDGGDSDEPYDPESKALRRLFLGRLSFGTTDELVRDYFERFGPLEEINVMKFPDSGKSRGFGFITFEQAQSVDDCQAARPHALDGKIIEVKRATARRGDAKNSPEAMAEVKKLWVGGFTEETSDEDITEYFEQFGGRVLAVEQVRYGRYRVLGTSNRRD